MTRELSKQSLLVSALAVILLATVGVVTYALWPDRLPAEDAPPAEVIRFVASEKFTQLPEDQQQRYVRTLARNMIGTLAAAQSVSEEEQDLAFMNAMQAMMNQHLDQWLSLDAQGKQAYLDNLVKQRGQRLTTRPSDPRDRFPGPGSVGSGRYRQSMGPERQKRFVENLPPDRRAAMAEFMSAARKARERQGR